MTDFSPVETFQISAQQAGRTIVELCKRYYGENDESVLPRMANSLNSLIMLMLLSLGWMASTL